MTKLYRDFCNIIALFIRPIAGIFLLVPAFAFQPADSIGTTKISGKLHIRYLVSPGETVYGISTKHKIAVTDLIELNPELENGLKVGQIINIPYTPAVADKVAAPNNGPKDLPKSKPNMDGDSKKTTHKVQAGETLYSLSKRYNVSVDDLMKWNNIELKVGQEVIVSGGQEVSKEVESRTDIVPPNGKGGSVVAVRPSEKDQPVIKSKEDPFQVKYKYDFDSSRQQVLIIPFDPYLYFSDADDEIAAKSNIPRTKVRQAFRRRMNALLDHPGYENIHLLGGKAIDSLSDLNKIYTSVTYNYQDVLYSPHYINQQKEEEKKFSDQNKKNNAKDWLARQKDKIAPEEASGKAVTAKDNGKYFGVLVKNPEFFRYFKEKYDIDYYIFVNQFEVKTNYEHCLDRAAQNYERTFTTHYSIFNGSGQQISGNRFNTHYNSNSNNIEQILVDNVQKIADRILADLPTRRK